MRFQQLTNLNQYCKQAFSGSFNDYIKFAKQHLTSTKTKAGLPVSKLIVSQNAPFELKPQKPNGKAILLIHGFTASPYFMHAIAQVLQEIGFLVRCILLPGHGAGPGDLLNVKLRHWQKALRFGVRSFDSKYEIHLCGYSLGATLASIYAIKHKNIKSVCLLAPANGISKLAFTLPISSILGKLTGIEKLKWLSKNQSDSIVGLSSYTVQGANCVYQAVRKLKFLQQKKRLKTPCFMVATNEDFTIKIKASLDFFKHNKNPSSQLYMYSKKKISFKDKRITVIDSSKLADDVKAISHVGIPFRENDAYFGRDGQYYGKLPDSTFYSETSALNLQNKNFKRLFFNPDFEDMAQAIMKFYSNKQ